MERHVFELRKGYPSFTQQHIAFAYSAMEHPSVNDGGCCLRSDLAVHSCTECERFPSCLFSVGGDKNVEEGE